MLVQLLLLCFCIDADTDQSQLCHRITEYQSQCMERLIQIEGLPRTKQRKLLQLLGFIENIESSLSECEWDGVKCTEGKVTHIEWENRSSVNLRLRLAWLPPTVQSAIFDDCVTMKPLDARNFPESLELFDAYSCDIGGSLDLTLLPRSMESISAVKNFLCGTAVLTDLPSRLRFVDLRANRIHTVFVRSASLPESFEKALFALADGTISYVALDGKRQDKRVQIEGAKRTVKARVQGANDEEER